MAREWNVARHGEHCAGCGHGFDVNETFRAVLYPGQEEAFERRDYCLSCEPAAEPAPIGQWRTHRPPPSEPKRRPFDREAIYDFFLRFEDADTEERLQFRFVLALLLWRKKVLQFRETLENKQGREVWIFSMPRDGSAHRVVKPELDEQRIEQLSERLEDVLSSPVEQTASVGAQDEPGVDSHESENESGGRHE